MPGSAHRFPFPEDFPSEAAEYISDDEQAVDDDEPKISFPETLLVSNLPIVDEGEKLSKLHTFITKKFESPGSKFTIDMPLDKSHKTGGCAWLKFASKKEAEKARGRIHGMKLGGEVISAILFDDYESIMETSDKFNENMSGKQSLSLVNDTKNWMTDDKCREQILLRFQQDTEVHWVDPILVMDPYYCGEREKEKGKVWCDWKVEWSVQGSYLVTMHRPGVCLWGGEGMTQKRKFMHQEVNFCEFSPDEKYLVTWNGAQRDSGDSKAYKMWEVTTGQCLMEKACPSSNPAGDGVSFPHFLFSPDSKFFCRCTEREVAVHTLPDCAPYKIPGIENGTLRFENGVAHFQFSPVENVLAVWSPHIGDSPSCLHVVNCETGKSLQCRSRPNFHAQMNWQSEGEYLCVMLSRRGKIDKATGQEKAGGREIAKTIDILRMKEKNVPVDTIEIADGIKTFAWEPKSHRFAVLTEHKDSASKTMLLIYSLSGQKCEQVASFELQSGAYSQIHWSPDGSYFVVAALEAGDLLWARLAPETNALELLQKQEQASLSFVQWDKSGRYLLTAVIQHIEGDRNVSTEQDAGFNLWTFQGRLLHSEKIEKLYNATFRPTPPSLLSKEEQANIKKNLKTHSRRFELLDDEARNRQRKEEKEKRSEAVGEFKGICETLDENYNKYSDQLGWSLEMREFEKRHAFRDQEETKEEMIKCTEEEIAVK